MTELSDPAVTSLIGSIYDCALDPSQWERTLVQLAGIFACEKAILSINELRSARVVIKKSIGWEPHWLKERSKHLPEIQGKLNPWLRRQSSLETPFVASREIPARDLESSAYVRDCLRPQGIVDVAHFFLVSTPPYFAELVLCWHEQHGIMTEREMELGALLLPHLRRSLAIANTLEMRTVEHGRMIEALDALHQAVVLTNERGRILYANRAAEEMLQNGGPIGAVRGILCARVRTANDKLCHAITIAGRAHATIGKTGIDVCLTEPNLPPVFAHVLPLARGELCSQFEAGAVAAVFIDSAPDGQRGADALAAAFRLTRGEANVLARLVAGRTLSESATDLGIARTTARTHLTHIFLKIGVSRQSDLMRLAMQAGRFAARDLQ
jgi:DNA-binding CsgD family transcriptional regulator/PAS domain-containing protein